MGGRSSGADSQGIRARVFDQGVGGKVRGRRIKC